MHVTDLSHPNIQRVIEVAYRKGVALDIRLMADTTHTAEETARVVDAELGQIVKSILFVAPRAEGRLVPIVCLVSGCNDVDLPRLAAVTGEVAIRQATAREVRDLTGFSTGGIPPFGHARDVRILMDQDLAQYQWIWAAAGTDTAVFRVAPRTLQMLSNAIVAPVATSTWMHAAAAPNLAYGVGSGA
jgi:prolyl-tRNA editing enzyme YbaK/EbsC (Cys-tRNA(Pro) deacylase)